MGLKSVNLWALESGVAWFLRKEIGRRCVTEGRWQRWGNKRREKAAVVDGEYSAILSITELKIEFRQLNCLYEHTREVCLFGVWTLERAEITTTTESVNCTPCLQSFKSVSKSSLTFSFSLIYHFLCKFNPRLDVNKII